MAKKRAGEMPESMKNKGVVQVKSTEEMKKEVRDNMENKSMLEMASEQENKVTTTVDENTKEIENKESNDVKIEESSKYVSNAKTSKAFEKALAKEVKKPKKEKTMIYLEETVMKQFKTLARTHEVSVTKLFEIACMDYIKGQEIDEILVAEYDAINKKKGRRKSDEDKAE